MADQTLIAIAQTLADLGHAGHRLAAAAVDGDLLSALAASHETRRLRAELARRPRPDGVTEEDRATFATLVEGGRVAAAVADTWRGRALPPASELVTTPLGVACLVDELLPSTWDVTRDLIVLVGPGLEHVCAMLFDLGQTRVIVVDDPAPTSYPAPAIAATSPAEVQRAVHTLVPAPPERVVVRSLGAAPAEQLHAIAEAVHAALSDLRVHENTVDAFSRTWLEQGLANLPALARWPSVDAVGDAFAGVPMVICAPGPSLAGNVAQLRALRGRAIVVGFSHSLRPLRAAGVVPDVVLTVDPQDVRYHFRDGDLDGVAALINAVTVHPALFELPVPRYLTLASNGALDRWLYQAVGGGAEIPGGGSVATTALSLGLAWRCDPIITVGLDLSFPAGKMYVDTSCDGGATIERAADGTLAVAGWSADFHRMKAAGGPRPARERAVELPGWHGGTVPSSFMFAMFHRWFVEQAAHHGERVRLFNCTEGGCAIPGMRHQPLAEVLAELTTTVDVAAAFDREIAATAREPRAARAQAWRERVARDLRRAGRLADRGAWLAAKDDARAHARLTVVEAELSRCLGRHPFIAMRAQRPIDSALDMARRPAPFAEYLAASRQLLQAAAHTCREVGAALAGAGASHG